MIQCLLRDRRYALPPVRPQLHAAIPSEHDQNHVLAISDLQQSLQAFSRARFPAVRRAKRDRKRDGFGTRRVRTYSPCVHVV